MGLKLLDDYTAYIIGKHGIWFTVSGCTEIRERNLTEFIRKIMDDPELMVALHDKQFNFDVHLLPDELEDLKNAVADALAEENNYLLQEFIIDD